MTWALGEAQCETGVPEAGCPSPAPTLLSAPLSTGAPTTLVTSTPGIPVVVGDDAGVFFLDFSLAEPALARLRPGFPEELLWTAADDTVVPSGPAVDATSVYWFAGRDLYRASRTSDGTDAAVVASNVDASELLVPVGGYLWWSDGIMNTVVRVDSTGAGLVETMATGLDVLGANDATVYCESDEGSQIIALDAIGAQTLVVDHLSQPEAIRSFVADDSALYWSNSTEILTVPATGGTLVPMPGVVAMPGDALTITADAVLYNFGPLGYQSTPR